MASTRRKPGQLGPQVEGYRAWLADRGYTWTTPGILEAVKPGRMQGHGGTAEVSGGAA